MFGLSFTHLVLLAIIMLVFIGPEQLPEVARTFARLLNEWKRASSEIQSSLTNTLKEDFELKREAPQAPVQAEATSHPVELEDVTQRIEVPTTEATVTVVSPVPEKKS